MIKASQNIFRSAKFKDLLRKNKAKRIAIFGSRVKGPLRKGSDYDFLVEFDKDADLLDQVGLKLDLESYLNGKVDIVSENSLSPYLEKKILNEAVYLK